MRIPIIYLYIQRILASIVILFLVVSLIFIITRLQPGDASSSFISPRISPKLIEQIKSDYKTESGIAKQYFAFVTNFIQGDFGISFSYRKPVIEVIKNYLPFTIIFGIVTFLFQLIVSFFLAVISVKTRGTFFDRIIKKSNIVLYSTPAFVTGLFFLLIFSLQLKIFPSSGLSSLDIYQKSWGGKIIDYIFHLTLPVLTLSLTLIPIYFKLLRDNLDNLLDAAFIVNLRSMGMKENIILFKHVIPNSLPPLISSAGIDFGFLLSGALITEIIFGLPGMGRLTVGAIFANDYPLILGCCFLASAFMILSNLLADIIRGMIDRRSIKGMLE